MRHALRPTPPDQFLALAGELAEPAALTAAWWQVLGVVLSKPLPVAGIAREMGLARQSVPRVADLRQRWPTRSPRCVPSPRPSTKASLSRK